VTESIISLNGENIQTLEVLFLTTIITLLPTLLVMMTPFSRYIIAFSFVRSAMGTQQTPPNIVLIGMALFLTLFTMGPTISEIRTEAYEPYIAEEISQEEFIELAQQPLKEFMLLNTKTATLDMYCELAGEPTPGVYDVATTSKLPMKIIVPAFVTCELQRAFEIGFLLYLPFMLIDIVVSSTLMSMGMIMLPPSMIAMPFKLLLFVALNGWELLFSGLIRGFN